MPTDPTTPAAAKAVPAVKAAKPSAPTPPYVMVRSVNPHREGGFSRAGLRFTREWRTLKVGAEDNLKEDTIGPATLKRLETEGFLAVKPATEGDVENYKAIAAASRTDKDAVIDDLLKSKADLEARLMRLEQAAKQPASDATK